MVLFGLGISMPNLFEETKESTLSIPPNATLIELDTYGYGGCDYDDCDGCGDYGCSGICLKVTVDGRVKTLWESGLYDNDPELADSLREELKEIFVVLGLDINEVMYLLENCIYDWEYEKCLCLEK